MGVHLHSHQMMMKVIVVALFVLSCAAINFPDRDGYVRIPGGMLMHIDCVREIPSGSHIEDFGADGVFIDGVRQPRCPHPIRNGRESSVESRSLPADGWQTWTYFQHPQNTTFSTFNGYFSVPNAPTKWGNARDGIVYIFTGLQNDNWIPNSALGLGSPPGFEIIQPVLQYGGGSYNGGGVYWGVASWYVTTDAGALYSSELKVNPGDNIYGVMEQTGTYSWKIESIIPSGQNSTLTVTRNRLVNNPWAYCTLEVYDIPECDYLPPSNSPSHFTELVLMDPNGPITPSWTVLTEQYLGGPSDNPCGALFTVIDPATIDLRCQGNA